MNHFVMFAFILVCAFYSNEINDHTRCYCSSSQPELIKEVPIKMFKAYGRDCTSKESTRNKLGKFIVSNNEYVIHKLNFDFEELAASEIRNYTI